MKPNQLLTISSLLTILLFTLHVTDDIVRGISGAGPANIFGIVIFVVWLFATLGLPERRSGYVITLLGGLFGAAMAILHMVGPHYPAIVQSRGGFFFLWTLFAMGTTGTFSFLLAARELWKSRSGKAR